MSDFETQIIYHGAPALMGLKQANLFSLPSSQLPEIRKEVAHYQKKLARLGISLQYLYCCCKRVFLLVYRKDKMISYLSQPSVSAFLRTEGYFGDISSPDFLTLTLAHLRNRIARNEDFPHEIGFFLGYPVDDVFAFIREKGQHYKVCGFWKVYGNVASATRTFQSYELCREQLMTHAKTGASIFSLLGAS